MTRPIDAEERAWALECLAAGDTLAEVSEWSNRSPVEWRLALGRAANLRPEWSERLALYGLGLTLTEVGERLGVSRHAIQRSFDKVKARGVPVPRPTFLDRIPEEVRLQIIAMADDLVVYRLIAKHFEIGEETVRKIAGPSRRDPRAAMPNFGRRA